MIRYYLFFLCIILSFIVIHRISKPNSINTIFNKIQKEIPSLYISSSFRPGAPNHGTGKAIDICSKTTSDILKAFEIICKENSDIRIGVGIELADRHIHLDPFTQKKCRKRFIEISKKNSYCVDNLSCEEIVEKVKKYY